MSKSSFITSNGTSGLQIRNDGSIILTGTVGPILASIQHAFGIDLAYERLAALETNPSLNGTLTVGSEGSAIKIDAKSGIDLSGTQDYYVGDGENMTSIRSGYILIERNGVSMELGIGNGVPGNYYTTLGNFTGELNPEIMKMTNVDTNTSTSIRSGAIYLENITNDSYLSIDTEGIRTPNLFVANLFEVASDSSVPTQSISDSSSKIANTAFVQSVVSNSITNASASAQVVNVTVSRAFQASDIGKILNCTAALTLTANNGLPTEFSCEIVQTSSGQVTLASGSMTIANSLGLTKTRGIAAIASVRIIAGTMYSGGDMA